MYPGWLIIGEQILDGEFFEIINNERAYNYARDAGVCWLDERDEATFRCIESTHVLPGGPVYEGPANDPAPWWDPLNPDTRGFLGVIGLDVLGAENSTRVATVADSITGGGVVGPLYYKARTLVVRALAIAVDECGMQAGLNWLRCQFESTHDPCAGDSLTFFDCCPCNCGDFSDPAGPCWIATMDEIENGPNACIPDWWPSTLDEWVTGPPDIDEEDSDWCAWVMNMQQFVTGPPAWGCCVETCVAPYLRQFHRARITSGPTVIERPKMHHKGVLAVIEFEIAVGDPAPYTMRELILVGENVGGGEGIVDPPHPPEPNDDDPFGLLPVIRREDLLPEPVEPPLDPMSWERTEYDLHPETERVHLGQQVFSIELTSVDVDSERVRVGVWADGELVSGYYVPYLPAGIPVTFDGIYRNVTTPGPDGVPRHIEGFVGDFGGYPVTFAAAPDTEDLVMTIDREPTDTTQVNITVFAAGVGCP